jgi:three-Cys-motif partner protein
MAPVDPTIWELDPHGRAKHLILQRHLDAWLPIMTRSFRKLVYVDGFAGPGIYLGGEPGSPILALRAALFNTALSRNPPPGAVGFLFIEERADRAEKLREETLKLTRAHPLPSWVKYFVKEGEFQAVMTEWFDRLSLGGRRPMFVFIDPFGYSGLPMALIGRIASVRHSECLITFTYKSINRWGGYGDPKKEVHLDALYDSQEWRQRWGNEQSMVDFYRERLISQGGFKYVCAFKMKDSLGVTEYFLAFATNDPKGLNVMKRAMWKVDPSTGRVFSDADDPDQLLLDIQIEPLRDLLLRRFGSLGWITYDEVVEFVRHTHYSEEMHLKEKTLVPMEKILSPKVLEVKRPAGKRKGTFGPGTRLRFM